MMDGLNYHRVLLGAEWSDQLGLEQILALSERLSFCPLKTNSVFKVAGNTAIGARSKEPEDDGLSRNEEQGRAKIKSADGMLQTKPKLKGLLIIAYLPRLLNGILPDEPSHKSVFPPCRSHVLILKNLGSAFSLIFFSYGGT